MKKFIVSILSVVCIMSFIACGGDPEVEEPENPDVVAPVVDPVDNVEDPVVEIDNSTALANLEKARKVAVDSGVDKKAPEQFAAIDALYNSVKEKADSKTDVAKESQDISNRFLALSAYINAKEVKEKVDSTEKAGLAQKLYDEGCTALTDVETMLGDADVTGTQLLERATKASTCFNSVYLVICKQIARDEKAVALTSKKNAESVKAQVSMKDKYNEAVALVRKGDSLYSMQDPAKAYDNYKAADEIFDQIFKEVSEKRAAALKAIEEAKKAVEESANVAKSADEENPITAPLDGIEEESTVLLEEDTYEDPSDSTVELSDDMVDPLQDLIDEGKKAIEENIKSEDSKETAVEETRYEK